MKKNYRKHLVQILLSTTFINRTKCRHCLDYSNFMYRVRNPPINKDIMISIRKFEYIRSTVKRMCDDYYLKFDPKLFRSNSVFSHDVSYKGYNPRMHRMRNVQKALNFTEFVACKCGQTSWAFNYKSCTKQPAFNRKTEKVHPKKFIY
jgi:hypothetical protein